jgi:ribosomal protein S18 acetylase RimI-like enzyme
MMLRKMSRDDLRDVNLLLSKAFTHGYLEDGLRNRRVPLCKQSFLEYYLNANPKGAFVIEEEDRLIAYCFSRLWGKTAWFGPLSVAPGKAGAGYGRRLVQAVVEHLKQAGAHTIGLEMAAISSRNLAFYSKLGFEVCGATVDMARGVRDKSDRPVDKDLETVYLNRVGKSEKGRLLEGIDDLAGRLQEGLIYSEEVSRCLEYGMGDAIVLHKGESILALMVAHSETYSSEEKRQFLKVNILQVCPEQPIEILDTCIGGLEALARQADLPALYIRVPLRYDRAFRYLLRNSFSIVQNDLRLTLRGYGLKDDPEMINFSKWE